MLSYMTEHIQFSVFCACEIEGNIESKRKKFYMFHSRVISLRLIWMEKYISNIDIETYLTLLDKI